MEIMHEVTGKDEPGMGKESEARLEAPGVPGDKSVHCLLYLDYSCLPDGVADSLSDDGHKGCDKGHRDSSIWPLSGDPKGITTSDPATNTWGPEGSNKTTSVEDSLKKWGSVMKSRMGMT